MDHRTTTKRSSEDDDRPADEPADFRRSDLLAAGDQAMIEFLICFAIAAGLMALQTVLELREVAR